MTANVTPESLDKEQLVAVGHDYVTGRTMHTPWYCWATTYRFLVNSALRVYRAAYGRSISLTGDIECGELLIREPTGQVVLHVDWSLEVMATC